MNSIIPVHGDLRLAGNIAADQNSVSFPLNPKIGTIIVRGLNLYVFIEVSGVQTWYPLVSLSGNVYQHIENVASIEWLVTHNLNTAEYWYQAQDTAGNIIVPTSITPIDANSFIATFPIAVAGNIVIVATSNMVVDRVFTNLINVGADVIIDVAGMMIGGKRVLTGGVTKIVDGTGKEIFFTDQTPLRLIAGTGVTLEFNDFDKSIKINSEPITNKSHIGLELVENIAPVDMPVSAPQAQADAVVLDDAKTYADMLLNDISVSASAVAIEASNRDAAIVAAIDDERIIITGEIAAAISHEVTVRDEAIAIEANIRKATDDAIMLSLENSITGAANNFNALNSLLTDVITTEVYNRNVAILVETNARIAADTAEVTARNIAIATAVTTLVGTAPVGLDTLGEIATALSTEVTNRDAAILIEKTRALAAEADLATTIASTNSAIPTLVSALTNDSNYQNDTQVNAAIQAVVGAAPAALNTLVEIASQLALDESAAASLTTVVATKAAITDVTNWLALKANNSSLALVATTGKYSDLLNKPTLATVAGTGSYLDLLNKPTMVSSFTNDSGYQTAAQLTAGLANKANLTANTFSGRQSISAFNVVATSGVIAINILNSNVQRIALAGGATFSITGWDSASVFSEVLLELGNGGNVVINWPTIKWLLPTTGATAVSFSAYLTAIGRTNGTLQVNGTDFVYLWSTDGGATVYGKVL